MFTERAQTIINIAGDLAASNYKPMVDTESFLISLASDVEGSFRLAACFQNDVKPIISDYGSQLPANLETAEKPQQYDDQMKELLTTAYDLAASVLPDRNHPGFINIRHLACAAAMSPSICDLLADSIPLDRETASLLMNEWEDEAGTGETIGDLVNKLRRMRKELLKKIFGQDHAVHTFVEGLYNAEVTASIDRERTKPSAVFVFAGPPGVGKTFLAEMSASFLGRPFKRFDMTGYTDHQAHNQLVGFARSYQGAHAGLLTGFVAKNPNGILLFDEIEKAHLNTVQLFYQILDAGRLEDKYTEEDVSFRDTIIIFTTNAGSMLYDNPNQAGIGAANSAYHRRTILSALEQEKNPTTGLPAFPPAICSRLGQGYPIMFNHLGVNELLSICSTELNRTAGLLSKKYFKKFIFRPLLPISLVFRAGGRADARGLRADTEKFVKDELFKYASLHAEDRTADIFNDIDEIRFNVSDEMDDSVKELYTPGNKPQVLLIGTTLFKDLCREHIKEIDWLFASNKEEAAAILASSPVDLVLLDLYLSDDSEQLSSDTVRQSLDHMQLSAKVLSKGRGILRKIHDSFPDVPVYLLSFELPVRGRVSAEIQSSAVMVNFSRSDGESEPLNYNNLYKIVRAIDEELFLACVRAGGARGLIKTNFMNDLDPGWNERCATLKDLLMKTSERLYLESRAHHLSRQRKALAFDTVIRKDNRFLNVELRDFRLERTVEASDAGEMVEDVQRPQTRFEDVIGAKEAKAALEFVVDWLKDPLYYSALGVKPPRGILLTGPPGTGKTMLARAVAGESDCAFLEKSATAFVTIWQGSGPQNVRDLFARARRYAPAIIFIDEIDAIGTKRTGGPGGGRAAEETLNAMLTEMDGFAADKRRPVIVLAATNLADRLDEALKRRFDQTIEVDRPDREARLAYLNKALPVENREGITPKTLERIAGQAAGMTIADLERIVQEAAVTAARKIRQADNKEISPLSDQDLESAFEKIRMGAAVKQPDQATLERVARHEAGHALLAWLGKKPPVQLTIVGRGGAAGRMESEQNEEQIIITKPEIEQQIREALGGRAAELLFYGPDEGLSSGAKGDLRQASAWAMRMVQEYGMDEDYGLFSLGGDPNQGPAGGPLSERLVAAAEKIVREQHEQTIALVKKHRAALKRLSTSLLEKNRLVREEIIQELEGNTRRS